MTTEPSRAARIAILAAVTAFTTVTCTSPAPAYDDRPVTPTDVRLAPGAHFGVAWVTEDVFATTFSDRDNHEVVLVAVSDGEEVGRFAPPERAECGYRIPGALTPLPTGELGLVAVCIDMLGHDPTELYAYDFKTQSLRSLGETRESAADQTWSPDMSELVYVADGSLCATLHKKDESGDGPLDVSVEIRGREVPLGEDLSSTQDGCTERGNARLPVFSPDGQTLAAMAAPVSVPAGQHRIDQTWSLISVTDGQASVILGGIQYPNGLAWLSPDRLVFAARVAGQEGLWVVDASGGELTRVGLQELAAISVDGSGRVLAAIEFDAGALGADWQNRFVLYDLAAFTRGS